MFPEAIQLYGTNGTDRDVYMLAPQGFNLIPNFGNDFTPAPFGFKHIKNNAQTCPCRASRRRRRLGEPPLRAQRVLPDTSRR